MWGGARGLLTPKAIQLLLLRPCCSLGSDAVGPVLSLLLLGEAAACLGSCEWAWIERVSPSARWPTERRGHRWRLHRQAGD
jgi:hypothetical protein